ncbi:MAG TPA: hypothetical protein VGJ28_24470 [Micromonosporaceae bacterium]|jgi:hypothetical protein
MSRAAFLVNARGILLVAVFGVIASVGLSACSSSGAAPAGGSGTTPTRATVGSTPATKAASGAAAAKLPPPCSLISAGDASSSLGYAVTSLDSSADNDPDQISCTYIKGSKVVMVVLIRQWTLAKFTADAAQEPGNPKPLSAVGTSAYLGGNDKGPVVLVWERGVAVVINGVSPIDADQVKFLAKVAVGQLDSPK